MKPLGWAKSAQEAGMRAAKEGLPSSANPYTRVSYKHHGPQKSSWWQAGYDEQKLNRAPCPELTP